MAVRGNDLRVRHVAPVVDERLDDLARAGRREPPVGRERHDEKPARRGGERAREIAAFRRSRIEVIERLGDAQVRVRVVVLGELLALMAKIGLDLEFGREREFEAFAQRAAEARGHLLVGEVRDVPDHPRDDQAAPRLGSVRVEVTVVKIGVGEDRLPRDLVERDVLRREVRRRRDHQCMANAIRIARRPRERLHPAEAATHDRRPLPDAQPIGEPRLRVDPVLDRDERKIGPPRLPGLRVRRQRSGRPEAAPQIVDADDEESVRVERLAGTHHVVPPADVLGLVLVESRDVVRSVERMTDEHRVRAVGIARPVRLVRELVARQRLSARERERRVELGATRDDRPRGAAARGRVGRATGRCGKGGHGQGVAPIKNRPVCSLTGPVLGNPLAAPL